MADAFIRLWEEVSREVPGEDHRPSITDRGKKVVCHSRGEDHEQKQGTAGAEYEDGRGHYIAYLERPGPGAMFSMGDEPVIRDARDHVVKEIMDRHAEILEMREYLDGIADERDDGLDDRDPDETATVQPPLQIRYLRAFDPEGAFKAGQLFQELSMAMRGMAVALPETTNDVEFVAFQQEDIRRGLQLVKKKVLSGRQVKIMHSILEAEEELEDRKTSRDPRGQEAREFWQITYDQLARDLEDLIPDPTERQQLLQVQRLNRAS